MKTTMKAQRSGFCRSGARRCYQNKMNLLYVDSEYWKCLQLKHVALISKYFASGFSVCLVYAEAEEMQIDMKELNM